MKQIVQSSPHPRWLPSMSSAHPQETRRSYHAGNILEGHEYRLERINYTQNMEQQDALLASPIAKVQAVANAEERRVRERRQLL
jgi:hypothetical protein